MTSKFTHALTETRDYGNLYGMTLFFTDEKGQRVRFLLELGRGDSVLDVALSLQLLANDLIHLKPVLDVDKEDGTG